MSILDLIRGNYRIVSVVGMAKNAGKTSALNDILYSAFDTGIRLGLTSIGRDGERTDVVTCTEKPMIYIERGTLIATAESLFHCSEAKLEVLEMTDYPSSLGRIVIARAVSSGNVEIGGPVTNLEIRAVSERMLEYGAELVLVDGALDRVSSASPAITDATILSTGAVLSRDMNKVIEQSIHRVHMLQIETVADPVVRILAEECLDERQIAVIDDAFNVRNVEARTALGAGIKIAEALDQHSRYVVIPGSLVTKTMRDLIAASGHFKNITLIVRDATKIFVDYRDWQLVKRAGLDVRVLEPIRVLAVTVNPYAPQGYYFDPKTFRRRLSEDLRPIPVFDVMEGESDS
jgi:hypothetical protein